MLYSDFSIDLVLKQMAEVFNKKSTPTRICSVLLEAMEIIQQLRRAAVPPPNGPLTLEELREMDGEPVWIKSDNWHCKGKWGLVSVWTGPTGDKFAVYVFNTKTGATLYPNQEYGRCWTAYRRRPEEGTK